MYFQPATTVAIHSTVSASCKQEAPQTPAPIPKFPTPSLTCLVQVPHGVAVKGPGGGGVDIAVDSAATELQSKQRITLSTC